MCVQQFDDSLNSAIRNTMSHFATVFIDVRAKGSTVGSCSFTQFQPSQKKKKNTNQQMKKKKKPPKTIVHGQGEKRRAQPPSAHKRSHTPFLTHAPAEDITGGTQSTETETLMILPQVHLRKPCYDFYFL